MIKVFISQPMSGYTNDEIIIARMNAVNHLNDLLHSSDIEIINNLQMEEEKSTFEYLGTDISLMDVDIVYFLKGWETHKGCMIEFHVAKEYEIQMIFEEKY